MIRETYSDDFGNDYVIVDNPDGSYWSGLKSTYEAQQVEHLTEIIPADEAPTK